MSNTANPEKCSLITNLCKPHKNVDFPEIVQPFLGLLVLKSVHGFVIVIRKMKPIAFLVFYFVIKMWENLCKKTFSNMENSSKNIKKKKKYSNRNTQKQANIISQIFRWIHIVPTSPSSFVWRWRMKIGNIG